MKENKTAAHTPGNKDVPSGVRVRVRLKKMNASLCNVLTRDKTRMCVCACVQAEELFLWIPRKMLMTVESAQNSVLGKAFK